MSSKYAGTFSRYLYFYTVCLSSARFLVVDCCLENYGLDVSWRLPIVRSTRATMETRQHFPALLTPKGNGVEYVRTYQKT